MVLLGQFMLQMVNFMRIGFTYLLVGSLCLAFREDRKARSFQPYHTGSCKLPFYLFGHLSM